MCLYVAHFVLLVLLVFSQASAKTHDDYACRISLGGVIEGKARTYTQDNSAKYCAYLGIPYAQPPIGKLRFQSPKPLDLDYNAAELKENDRRNYKALKNVCLQRDISAGYMGDEDCLYLNVYTPMQSKIPIAKKYPVMVYIHGGSFHWGSGNLHKNGPDYLLKEDVIMVTFNYRLGVFGFLSAPKWGIWGNMGLKDQRLALRWVHENIENFGGDRNRVTIFGLSSGASSVHYFLFDKYSNGLYQRAILQSGTALNGWAIQLQPRHRFAKLRNVLNITREEELLKVNAKKLLASSLDQVPEKDDKRRSNLAFNPVIESNKSPDPFVTSPILEQMENGKFQQPKVNIMMGFSNGEGLQSLSGLKDENDKKITDALNDVERMIPLDAFIWLNRNGTEQREIIKKLADYYNEKFKSNLEAYSKLAGDAWFIHSIYRTVNAMASCDTRKRPKVYFYRLSDYTYSSYKTYVLAKINPAWEYLPGSAHSDDLGYVFGQDFSNSSEEPHYVQIPEDAQKTHHKMVSIWTNFAKTGKPLSPYNPDLDDIVWETYNYKNQKYLDLGKEHFKMRSIKEAERMQIWEEVYETGLRYCKRCTNNSCTLG